MRAIKAPVADNLKESEWENQWSVPIYGAAYIKLEIPVTTL